MNSTHSINTRSPVASPRLADPTRPDPTRPDPTRPDPTRPDPTRPDPTRPDPTRPDPTRPDPTRPDPTRPSSTFPPLCQRRAPSPAPRRGPPRPPGGAVLPPWPPTGRPAPFRTTLAVTPPRQEASWKESSMTSHRSSPRPHLPHLAWLVSALLLLSLLGGPATSAPPALTLHSPAPGALHLTWPAVTPAPPAYHVQYAPADTPCSSRRPRHPPIP